MLPPVTRPVAAPTDAPLPEPSAATPRQLNRRRFIVGGFAAAAAVAGGGAAVLRRRGVETVATRSFHSRPDLQPPTIKVRREGGPTAPGLVFVAPKLGPGTLGPLIVDDTGEPVWVRSAGALVACDLRVQQYRGSSVLTWWEGKSSNGYGQGSFVIADHSYAEVTRVRAGHGDAADLHEMVITPAGTALIGAYVPVADGRGATAQRLLESVVQEVDIATGDVLFEWHSRDHVGPEESFQVPPDDPDKPYDYFHLNSIDLDGDYLLVSSRNTQTAYKVRRSDGAVAWRLGGKNTDFRIDQNAQFAWQHDVRHGPDGTITMFDNSASPKTADHSRGLVLAVDESTLVATFRREYVHPTRLSSGSQGNLQALPNGGTFIGWGFRPRYSEYAPDGELVMDAEFTGGGQSYRSYRFPWVGRPTDPPRVAVDRRGGGLPTAYASWNGATEVATWQVRAGARPDSLEAVATAPRTGFETAIKLPNAPAYVAAAAFDTTGNLLGASSATEV
jgi:hypothetical protein